MFNVLKSTLRKIEMENEMIQEYAENVLYCILDLQLLQLEINKGLDIKKVSIKLNEMEHKLHKLHDKW